MSRAPQELQVSVKVIISEWRQHSHRFKERPAN